MNFYEDMPGDHIAKIKVLANQLYGYSNANLAIEYDDIVQLMLIAYKKLAPEFRGYSEWLIKRTIDLIRQQYGDYRKKKTPDYRKRIRIQTFYNRFNENKDGSDLKYLSIDDIEHNTELDLINKLSKRNIVNLKLQGYKNYEIAKIFNVTPVCICLELQRIKNKINSEFNKIERA